MTLLKKHASALVTLILGLFFVVSLSVSWQESATFDEKAHIPAAYSYVRYLDMRLNPEHPPLLKDLAGLPLLAFNLTFPLQDKTWTQGINEQWVLGEKFLFESGNDADTILFWSRLPITLIALVLGLFIYLWTKELAGTVAGLFALVLFVCDPNILGHSHYVTTDIGIAAFVFIATYFFVKFLKKPTDKHILAAGIALGLAQLAKFSAVLLFPLFGLAAILYALASPSKQENSQEKRRGPIARVLSYLWKYIAVVSVCFIAIWILYAINTWHMPADKIAETAQSTFNNKTAGIVAKNIITTLSSIPVITPLSEYLMGVFMVFARVAGGNTHFFLGEVTEKSSPAYFPVIFLLKETLPLLFLLLFSLGYTLFRTTLSFIHTKHSLKETLRHSFQSRIAQYTMAGFVMLYAYLSITGNLNIGFRHLFPILPFLYVLTAKTVFDFLRRQHGNPFTRTVFNTLVGAMTLWIVATPILAYPDYLSYFNPIGGGSSQGYHYATDSNYDWGQDLKKLKVWVDEYNACTGKLNSFPHNTCTQLTQSGILPTQSPIDTIRIDYFGGSRPAYYFGDNFIPWYGSKAPESGWYAISTLFYQENLYRTDHKPGEQTYAWLSQYQPVARAGQSMLIFYISPESLEIGE